MVVCKGLEEFSVNSVESCMEYLRRGTRERQTAATFSNQNSSRSHSIFTFKLLVRETVAVGEEIIRTGQVCIRSYSLRHMPNDIYCPWCHLMLMYTAAVPTRCC